MCPISKGTLDPIICFYDLPLLPRPSQPSLSPHFSSNFTSSSYIQPAMSQTVNLDRAEIAQAEMAKEGLGSLEKPVGTEGSVTVDTLQSDFHGDGLLDDDTPTEEEMHTLRRVSGRIKWAAYSVAICEMAERFSYYGSSVLFTNFIVQPLPTGSNTGAGHNHGGQSGGLGLGTRTGQGISLTNQFLAYIVPLFG